MRRFLCLIVLIEGAISLRMLTIDVPPTIIAGQGTRLSCSYELENDVLYSIKWYRDDVEFFRFVPSDRPSGQYFPVNGIKVDMEQSSNGTVYLRDVDSSAQGTYRCEVSGDAPSFQTVFAEKHLSVEEVPVIPNSAADRAAKRKLGQRSSRKRAGTRSFLPRQIRYTYAACYEL